MENNRNYLSDEELAAYLDGQVSAEEATRILSALGADDEASEILSLSPQIDAMTDAVSKRIIPMWALAAANPQNLCSFDCETFILRRLDFDIDHWTLLETAKANNWIREEGTPLHHVGRLLELKGLHVERKYDATVGDLEQALAQDRQVIAVVDKNILDGKPAETVSYHAVCVTGVRDGAVTYLDLETMLEESRDFLPAWRCSGNYMVAAALNPTGYNPQPINVEDIDLDADLEDLTEAIAENAHDIWARARMDEGWTYGPVRDDGRKQHPDLVPYAQLPDSEKQYDRLMAMNTLRLVRRLGFEIIYSNNN